MFKHGEIAFGDTVRIVESESTRLSGHAGLVGSCYGLTTPSVTQIEVIGDDVIEDVALNVHFKSDRVTDAWFVPELVTLVDHAVGSRATLGDRAFLKTADGEWREEQQQQQPTRRRRWFHRSS